MIRGEHLLQEKGRCHVCIRECRLGESFCGRRDHQGRLKDPEVICAQNIDSLFDKPIIHFGTDVRVLSIGSWGCNLRCLGCQNARLSWTDTGANLGAVRWRPDEVVAQAQQGGCRGVCYTYNEPAVLREFVEETTRKARAAGLWNILVTNSTLTPASVEKLAPWTDAVAADIKSLEDEFYIRYCGADGISDIASKILRCIECFCQAGCHLEIRTNIIPGANDREEDFGAIAAWIRDHCGAQTPWHITRYFPAHRLQEPGRTSAKTIFRAQEIGFREGLKFVHVHLRKGCDCAGEANLVGSDASPARGAERCCPH